MAATIGLNLVPGTIAAGQSLSGAINLGAERARGIVMPGVWTAAVITFQVSVDGTNFLELLDPRPTIGYSSSAGYTVAVSQYVVLDPVIFDGVNIIKIRSGTSGSPVNQIAQAVLNIVTRLY